jgi:hypothetical protein
VEVDALAGIVVQDITSNVVGCTLIGDGILNGEDIPKFEATMRRRARANQGPGRA